MTAVPLRFAVFFLALAGVAAAQTNHGTITGTVQDPATAVVPNAAVVATNVETGAVYQTLATATGNFTVPSLPAGNYSVSVEAPGFRKYIGKNVRVQVAQVARLDVTLEVGATTESITVEGAAPQLKSESVEQSINVSGNRINSLPLNFGGGGGNIGAIRAPLTFMVLSPGVAGTGTTGRVNGQPPNTYRVFVDGQDTTNNNDTTSTSGQPSVEMIEEFSLQTSNFSAEFGQVAGGMFTFATRSGTNQLHGSLYEYFNNEALDAAKPYVNHEADQPQARFRLLVKRSDLDSQDLRRPQPDVLLLQLGRVPQRHFGARSAQHRPHSGVSQWRLQRRVDRPHAHRHGPAGARDPWRTSSTIRKTSQVVGGRVVRDPFPETSFPRADMDPVALKIQALIPLPDYPGNINNWQQAPKYNKISATPAIKIDHSLSPTQEAVVLPEQELEPHGGERPGRPADSADGVPGSAHVHLYDAAQFRSPRSRRSCWCTWAADSSAS